MKSEEKLNANYFTKSFKEIRLDTFEERLTIENGY